MPDELLVRTYDVGFGDCIYVQIPDGTDGFHLLVDCGTSSPANILEPVLAHLCSELPLETGGRRRLDLLVTTHPHADHIKGFDPTWLKDVHIKRIWLPVFMDSEHPQAERAHALQADAERCALALMQQGLSLSPATRARLERNTWSICNPGALRALRKGLAEASGIDDTYPRYVARDLAMRLTPTERARYEIDANRDTTRFRGFQEKGTCLRVLAPEWDIDKYYLGRALSPPGASFEPNPMAAGMGEGYCGTTAETPPGVGVGEDAAWPDKPDNISPRDFRILSDRLLELALAFSDQDNALKNNTSVVLLLEWRGRRLLFAGDAEWEGNGVEMGRRNSAWDVMLSHPKVSRLLLRRLDLIKLAHHGSHNGSPFREGEEPDLLEKMVWPKRTHVVVSTEYGKKAAEQYPVPYAPLMKVLGGLAVNARTYPNDPVEEMRSVPQPQRTDLEPLAAGAAVRYIDVRIPPYPA